MPGVQIQCPFVGRARADHPDYLANLGGALRIRFARSADRADLDGAIDLLQQTTMASPADDTVLAALPGGRWAHFACHGASDLSNPSASCLLLTDHQQRPLTVTDVAQLWLHDAGLAFLSACSTGRPGGRLTDEAIHLAAAFQLVGYRHVIATLWPIGDRHAVPPDPWLPAVGQRPAGFMKIINAFLA